MELNGLRQWRENRNVLAFAAAAGKPLISGGDRHTIEANSVLNLTNAGLSPNSSKKSVPDGARY